MQMLTKLKSDKFISVLLFLIVSFVFFYGIIRAADGIVISNDRGTILFPSGSTPATNGEVGYNGTNFLLRTGGNNASLSGLGPLDVGGSPGGGHGRYKNLQIQSATTTSVTITADTLDAYNANNQVVTLFNVSLVPSTTSSGALGLDTGSVSIDTIYAIWVLVKSDGSASTAVYSTSFTSPTLPSGYTNAYKIRVGACFTAHTTTALLSSRQSGNFFQFDANVDSTVVLNGTLIVNNSTATTEQAIDISSRIPSTGIAGNFWVQLSHIVSNTNIWINFFDHTGGSEFAIFGMEATTNASGQVQNMQLLPISLDRKIHYRLSSGTGTPGAWIAASSYWDSI